MTSPAHQNRTALTRDEKLSARLCWLSCALMFALSYVVFYALCLRPSSDISIHATWAAEGNFLDPVSFLRHGAHPMWHLLVAALLLFPIPLPVAAALVTALCKTLELALFHRLFTRYLKDRLRSVGIALLALCCATVSSLCLPWFNPTVYFGVGTPNTWHSCTQLIAMVWMLLCVPATARCYDDFMHLLPAQGERAVLPWRQPLLLGAMLFLSLLAKPTFMQVFLPAACLFFLAMWIRHPANSRFFRQILLCVLPAVLFMLVQYLYYFGYIVPSQGSMILELSWKKLGDVCVCVLLMQAFPLYVLLFCGKGEKKDTLFWLTLIFDAVGVLEFLFLGESGRRAADGNFGWGMMGAALMMWAVALIRFWRAASADRAHPKALRPKYWAGLALLGWHLVSGVYYVIYLLTTSNVL